MSQTEESMSNRKADCGNGEAKEDTKRVKHWIYELKMPDTVLDKIDAYCQVNETTRDELFTAILRYCIRMAKDDPEGFVKSVQEMQAQADEDFEIEVVRSYPVYEDETKQGELEAGEE